MWPAGPAVRHVGRLHGARVAERAFLKENEHAAISRNPEGKQALRRSLRAAVVTAEAGSSKQE